LKILCVDTCSDLCSVALLEDLLVLKELNLHNGKTHSENLMPLVQQLFKECNITISDIDLIACDKGPGSFTGIRIGISSVKAIAEVLQIPVIGICSLDSLSFHIKQCQGIICSLIDARNSQAYCGIFNEQHVLLHDYIADDINVIIEHLKQYKSTINFVGNGAILYKDLLINSLSSVNFISFNELNAKNIGICALNQKKDFSTENADALFPLYLRKSQAERMKDLSERSSN